MQLSRAMRSSPVLLSLLLGFLLAACSSGDEVALAPTPRPLQTAPPATASTPAPTPEASVAAPEVEVDGPTDRRAPVAGRSDIAVTELKTRTDNESDVVVIDVRTKREYVGGHLAGAKLIPTNELTRRLAELTPYKDKEIHVICAVGGRSHKVVDYLVGQQGFSSVVNVTGGVKAWTRAGYPVVKGE